MKIFKIPTVVERFAYMGELVKVVGTFALLYPTSNMLASRFEHHFELWLQWELFAPFIPSSILLYYSILILFIIPLFILNSDELHAIGRTLLMATLWACLCFVLIPAPLGYSRETPFGTWETAYDTLFQLDLPTNTFPSLHITYTVICFLGMQKKLFVWRPFFLVWALAITISVVLTHQHHLFDIIGGLCLGFFCFRKYFKIQNKVLPGRGRLSTHKNKQALLAF